jgi:hypothetical protein
VEPPVRHPASDTPEADLTFFVASVRPDGRPHSAGVGATWVDGALYFTSGPGTLKSRNLAANPACSAGPAPWHLPRLTLHTAVGVATAEPHGATRWRFG